MKKILWAVAALSAIMLMAGCQPGPEQKVGTDTPPITNPDKKPGGETAGMAADSSGVMYAANFADAVAGAEKDDKYVLIKFTADWCGPCHAMSDDMKKTDLSAQLAKVIPVEVDVDKEKDGAAVKNHMKKADQPIPYLVLIDKNGTEIANHTGQLEMDEFKAWLDKNTKA